MVILGVIVATGTGEISPGLEMAEVVEAMSRKGNLLRPDKVPQLKYRALVFAIA